MHTMTDTPTDPTPTPDSLPDGRPAPDPAAEAKAREQLGDLDIQGAAPSPSVPQSWTVQDKDAPAIRELIKARDIAKLKGVCNKRQFEKAIDADDPEKAYMIVQLQKLLGNAAQEAHQALWVALGDLFPEIDPNKRYTLDEDDLVVEPKILSPLESLKESLEGST